MVIPAVDFQNAFGPCRDAEAVFHRLMSDAPSLRDDLNDFLTQTKKEVSLPSFSLRLEVLSCCPWVMCVSPCGRVGQTAHSGSLGVVPSCRALGVLTASLSCSPLGAAEVPETARPGRFSSRSQCLHFLFGQRLSETSLQTSGSSPVSGDRCCVFGHFPQPGQWGLSVPHG